MGALLSMVGQDAVGDIPQDIMISSYLDYVKIWTHTNDRGGLRHVSNDTYRCFIAIEMITYFSWWAKKKVMCEVVGDENVNDIFWWRIENFTYEKSHKSGLQSEDFQWQVDSLNTTKLQLKRRAPKEQEKNCISMLVEITLNLI